MDLRLRIAALAFGIGLAFPGGGRCAHHPDLDSAFVASFGHGAPVLRTLRKPIHDDSSPPRLVEIESITFRIRPIRLVLLSSREFALISYEVDPKGAHSEGGEIAVSYLKWTSTGWKLEHLWPELLYSGIAGQPANAGAELHRFGSDPLFMARSMWCGMDECSEWIGVIRLSRRRPVAYDDILAGATSPVGKVDPDMKEDTCENYDFSARIEPPRRSGSLFSIRYDGWTAAGQTLFPKTPLHLRTDYGPDGTELAMRPVVAVPTCGR